MNIKDLSSLRDNIIKAESLTSVISNVIEVQSYENVNYYRMGTDDIFMSVIEFKNSSGKRSKVELNGRTEVIDLMALNHEFGRPLISYSIHDNITVFLWRDSGGLPLYSCYSNGVVIYENSNIYIKKQSGEILDVIKDEFFGFDNLSIYV